MSWDAVRFCRDHGVPYSDERLSAGWLSIPCPYCGHSSASYKGGIETGKGYYNCWKCGAKDLRTLVRKLTGVGGSQLDRLVASYATVTAVRSRLNRKGPHTSSKPLDLPGGPLTKSHRAYLTRRGFDPDELVERWGVQGTKPVEWWRGGSFGSRIIIPIRDRTGRLVSFQGRDITGRDKLRYKACPVEEGLVHYKTTLYGLERVTGDTVGVVEGVMDAWRMGEGWVATYGTSLKLEQVKELSAFRRVVFVFDGERLAQASARKYAGMLAGMGIEAEVVDLGIGERDPGDLSPAEAREVRARLEV